MPGALDVVNWICAGVSTIFTAGSGACLYYSLKQVKKCEDYALRVTAIEEMDALDEIERACGKALADIEKFGPGATDESIRGLDFLDAVGKMREYLRIMSRHSHILGAKTAKNHCSQIEYALETAKGNELKAARHIYDLIFSLRTEIGERKRAAKARIMVI